MTVKKTTRCGGYAALVSRQRLQNTNQQVDMVVITKPSSLLIYNISVGFNEKDQLQLTTREERSKTNDSDDKLKLLNDLCDPKTKSETILIEDITNCVNIENYPNCRNTLVFYITKNLAKEAIALRFENEQDFKRIYFTYKYFKMRNRLTKGSPTNYTSSENLFLKKKNYSNPFKGRKNSIDEKYDLSDKRISEFDLLQTTDNDGLTHISVQQKQHSRFDQPLSLIGIRRDADLGEIDSIIYTDVDIPVKPDRKRLFQKNKPKAPLPPSSKENSKILKGEFVRVNVEKAPDVIPKENRLNKTPDILMIRDSKIKSKTFTNNFWMTNNKVSNNGYESDREEWRSSRSQFSTTAFDSLARPTKMAMALTLRKPLQRLEPAFQYYRLPNEPQQKTNPIPFTRPNNFFQRPSRLQRPPANFKQNLLNNDHRKYASLQNLEVPKKSNELKKLNESKKPNYSNLSNRISGLTNKLRDLSTASNTIGRFKAQSHSDVANLKPVLKMNAVDGAKRPVVRTCSAEPPKKVTFSAFATVQVV